MVSDPVIALAYPGITLVILAALVSATTRPSTRRC